MLNIQNDKMKLQNSKNFDSAQKSKKFLTCPNCKSKLKKVKVEIEDAKTKVISYQCNKCDYFVFEPESALKVIKELKTKEAPLKIKQKIIKLSKNRLGLYFNRDVARSLKLRSGESILVSIPNNKKIVLDIIK